MADVQRPESGPERRLPRADARDGAPSEAAGDCAGAVTVGRSVPEGVHWQVTTECSEYTLDLAVGRVCRTPVDGPGLRGDGAWVRLRSVLDLRVGYPMVLVLLLRDDGISTIRCSSRVLRIRRVTPPLETS